LRDGHRNSYPLVSRSKLLQGDCLPLDDGGNGAEAASTAEFPEMNKLYG
jgi:hypothetical protein